MKYAIQLGELYIATGFNPQRHAGNWSSSPNAKLFDDEESANKVALLFPGSTVTTLYDKGEIAETSETKYETVGVFFRGAVRTPMEASVYINMFDKIFTVSTREHGRMAYDSLEKLLADWTLIAPPVRHTYP